MYLNKIIFILSPIAIFYIVYLRYFHFKPEYLKHLEAFFLGITSALLLILISPVMNFFIFHSIFLDAFLKAALLEKTFALFFILFLHKRYPNFTIIEGAISGMIYSMGFAAIENIFYMMNYGLSSSVIRVFYSVPMHMVTCGILSYYLGCKKFSSTSFAKKYYLLKGFIISIILHGLFDLIFLTRNSYVYISSLLLIATMFFLELLLSKAKTYPGLDVIRALNIRFEDWITMWKQPRYERWINQSMERGGAVPVSFFMWRPGVFRFLLFVFFISVAVAGSFKKQDFILYFNLRISSIEEILLFVITPLSIAISIIIVGAVNPEFFKYSEIKIPIITDVEIKDKEGNDDFLVTYDFTATSCFLRTFEPLGVGNVFKVKMEVAGKYSVSLYVEVAWEKHRVGYSPSGTIVKILNPSLKFYLFLFKYHIFKTRKAFIFILKLPGFESLRKLFARPISTMQEERFYNAGDYVFKEGDSSCSFYFIKKGEIGIYKSKDEGSMLEINTIKDGEIFGELSVFSGSERKVSAIAKKDTLLALADRNNLQILIKSNPEFAVNLFEKMSERILNSEEILITNIKYLEYQKIEKQRILDSLSFFLLIVLGDKLDIHKRNIDMIDIKRMIKMIDDEVSMELAKVLLMKRDFEKESEDQFKIRITKAFDSFYNDYVFMKPKAEDLEDLY